MKYAIAITILALATLAHAQTNLVAVPGPTAQSVALTWTIGAGCTASATCGATVYRIAGQCPALPVTGSNPATYTDPAVTAGGTYSYVVEDYFTGQSATQGPSACVTVTVPNVPAVPTGLTAAG